MIKESDTTDIARRDSCWREDTGVSILSSQIQALLIYGQMEISLINTVIESNQIEKDWLENIAVSFIFIHDTTFYTQTHTYMCVFLYVHEYIYMYTDKYTLPNIGKLVNWSTIVNGNLKASSPRYKGGCYTGSCLFHLLLINTL